MNGLRRWLETAAAWRAASLMFALPTPAVQDELCRLCETMPGDLAVTPRKFAGIAVEDWEEEYHRVLGAGGCAACESSYEENALAGRGPVLAGIAGYYQAFSYHPENPGSETPDHLSIETGFLAYLAMKVAFADQAQRGDEKAVALEAYDKFRDEHPRHWLPRFCEELSPYDSPLFSSAAQWVLFLTLPVKTHS